MEKNYPNKPKIQISKSHKDKRIGCRTCKRWKHKENPHSTSPRAKRKKEYFGESNLEGLTNLFYSQVSSAFADFNIIYLRLVVVEIKI